MFGYRVGTPSAGGSTGWRWTWLKFLARVANEERRFHVESCRVWGIKIETRWRIERRRGGVGELEEGVSDVCVHGCRRSTDIYGYTYVDVCILPSRCTERPTAMFTYLLVEAYLFRANAMIRRSPIHFILVT